MCAKTVSYTHLNRQKAETHTSFWAMSALRLWRATAGKTHISSRGWTQKAVWNAGRWTRNSIEDVYKRQLKEEGYEVVLVNSNPATIMTDTAIADKVYMEPLKLEYLAKILRYERPDAIVPGIGGQTGLNLAMQLERKGVLRECQVELLGTNSTSIERAEDRELFKELCEELGEPVLPSLITHSMEEGVACLLYTSRCV